MKYLLIALFLSGCSVGLDGVTTKKANSCAELADLMNGTAEFFSDGNCVVTEKNTSLSQYFKNPEDAIDLITFQKKIQRAPFVKKCTDTCLKQIPKKDCDFLIAKKADACLFGCYSAEGIDEFIKTGKTPLEIYKKNCCK